MARAALAALSLGALANTGCVKSTINASPNLRWWLFSNFGASKVCPEVMKRGVPLRVSALGALQNANVGRFFPTQCVVRVDDPSQSMILNVAGSGYAFLPLTRRIGFTASFSVEYRPDFRMEDDSMYVWGKFNRMTQTPELRLLGVENSVVNLATQTPLGDVASVIGQSIMTSEVNRGFTVVRQDDGDDFTLGILNPPDKPKRHFKTSEGRTLLESSVTEIHAASRDYVGPFEVTGNGQALFLKYRLSGANVSYSVVPKFVGDQWRAPYEAAQPIGAPPQTPIASGVVQAGERTQSFVLSKGSYYIVLENLAAAPMSAFGVPLTIAEPVGNISYSVELGDRP